MARPGISYREVAEVASQLLGQGKNPTIEQIRLLLGTGSSTTIANHLRQWKENQALSQLTAVKEQIPHELTSLVKGLWERVIDQSDETVVMIEERYQQSFFKLQQELEKYKHNNRRWQRLFMQWGRENERLTQEKKELEKVSEQLQTEGLLAKSNQQALMEQIQQQQVYLDDIQAMYRQQQINFEKFQESEREQKKLYELEIKQLKETIGKQSEEIIKGNHEYHSLEKMHDLLRKEHEYYVSNVMTLNLENEKKHQVLLDQYQQVQTSFTTKAKELIDIQLAHKEIAAQFTLVQQSLEKALADNRILEQEKWVLIQEKAQLEGRLDLMSQFWCQAIT